MEVITTKTKMDSDRLMRNMMQSMGMGFGMPMHPMFAGFDSPFNGLSPMHNNPFMLNPMTSMITHGSGGFMGNPMSMPIPMPDMMMMVDPTASFRAIDHNGNGGNSIRYCSTSITKYTTDEHGRPQVYQQSSEVKQGPNGLKETKSSVRDSRTGHQELAIGHHMRDKARIKKKSKNALTGDEEQCEDLIGIEEDEAEAFEQNWQRQARNVTQYNNIRPPSSSRNNRLALTSSAHEDGQYQSARSHKPSMVSTLIDKVAMKTKKKKKNKEPKA